MLWNVGGKDISKCCDQVFGDDEEFYGRGSERPALMRARVPREAVRPAVVIRNRLTLDARKYA